MIELIEKIASNAVKIKFLVAKVDQVDESNFTVDATPINGESETFDIKIRVVIDAQEEGIISIPSIGSRILVGMADQVNGYLLQCEKIDRLIWKISGFRMEIDNEGNMTFNEGENDGIVKLPELKNQVDKLNNFLTAIKNTFNSWVPVPSDGGAALKSAMVSALASQQVADLSNAGNEKIKH